MMRMIFLLLIAGFAGISACAQNPLPSKQLVIVKTSDWNSIQGKLSVFNLIDNQWVKADLADIPIVVGRTGLAWGEGLHDPKLMNGYQKKEGDGKSPAGIFPIEGFFSYEPIRAKMDLLVVDQQTFCVDDVRSKYYNQIVHSDTVKVDWTSAETMRMPSDAYKYGIFVGYNTEKPVPGKGSCIFLHIWSGKDKPTAGCTAMTEQNMLRLMELLDPANNPLLVQVPEKEYSRLKNRYKLP